MTMLRRLLSCIRGAAAAEMALLTPLAVLIIFSAVEGGHYFYQQHQVLKGVRDGARFAARQSFDDINCRGGSSSIDSGLEADIKLLTRTGQIADVNAPSRIPNWTDTSITVTVTCPSAGTIAEAETGIFDGVEPAPQVTIRATPSYDSFFDGLGVLTDSFSLSGTQQALVMGV